MLGFTQAQKIKPHWFKIMPSDTQPCPALPKQLWDTFAVGWVIWYIILDYLLITSCSSPGALKEEFPYLEQIFVKKCRSIRNTMKFTEVMKIHSWWSLLFKRTWLKKVFFSSVSSGLVCLCLEIQFLFRSEEVQMAAFGSNWFLPHKDTWKYELICVTPISILEIIASFSCMCGVW